MGDFLIKISAMGGHGCNRTAKAGEVFEACNRFDCIDCYVALMVHQMNERFPGIFSNGGSATMAHWPVEMNKLLGRNYTEATEVVDDLLYVDKWGNTSPRRRKRIKGQFGG